MNRRKFLWTTAAGGAAVAAAGGTILPILTWADSEGEFEKLYGRLKRPGRRFMHSYFKHKDQPLSQVNPNALANARKKAESKFGPGELKLRRATFGYAFEDLEASEKDVEAYFAFAKAAMGDFESHLGIEFPTVNFRRLRKETEVEEAYADETDYLFAGRLYKVYNIYFERNGAMLPGVDKASMGGAVKMTDEHFEFPPDRGFVGTLRYQPTISGVVSDRGPLFALSTPAVETLHHRLAKVRHEGLLDRANDEWERRGRPRIFTGFNVVYNEEMALEEAVAHTAEYRWLEGYVKRNPRLGFDEGDVRDYARPILERYDKHSPNYMFVGDLYEKTPRGKERELVHTYINEGPREVAKIIGRR